LGLCVCKAMFGLRFCAYKQTLGFGSGCDKVRLDFGLCVGNHNVITVVHMFTEYFRTCFHFTRSI